MSRDKKKNNELEHSMRNTNEISNDKPIKRVKTFIFKVVSIFFLMLLMILPGMIQPDALLAQTYYDESDTYNSDSEFQEWSRLNDSSWDKPAWYTDSGICYFHCYEAPGSENSEEKTEGDDRDLATSWKDRYVSFDHNNNEITKMQVSFKIKDNDGNSKDYDLDDIVAEVAHYKGSYSSWDRKVSPGDWDNSNQEEKYKDTDAPVDWNNWINGMSADNCRIYVRARHNVSTSTKVCEFKEFKAKIYYRTPEITLADGTYTIEEEFNGGDSNRPVWFVNVNWDENPATGVSFSCQIKSSLFAVTNWTTATNGNWISVTNPNQRFKVRFNAHKTGGTTDNSAYLDNVKIYWSSRPYDTPNLTGPGIDSYDTNGTVRMEWNNNDDEDDGQDTHARVEVQKDTGGAGFTDTVYKVLNNYRKDQFFPDGRYKFRITELGETLGGTERWHNGPDTAWRFFNVDTQNPQKPTITGVCFYHRICMSF